MEQNVQPVFGIEKLYVKDLSLEVPNAPEIFLEREPRRSTSSSIPAAVASARVYTKSC
jgi:preprotein translocase subunit SecB